MQSLVESYTKDKLAKYSFKLSLDSVDRVKQALTNVQTTQVSSKCCVKFDEAKSVITLFGFKKQLGVMSKTICETMRGKKERDWFELQIERTRDFKEFVVLSEFNGTVGFFLYFIKLW